MICTNYVYMYISINRNSVYISMSEIYIYIYQKFASLVQAPRFPCRERITARSFSQELVPSPLPAPWPTSSEVRGIRLK